MNCPFCEVALTVKDFYDWQLFPVHTPDGCSMSFVKIDEPAFDLFWAMPDGLALDLPERFNNERNS